MPRIETTPHTEKPTNSSAAPLSARLLRGARLGIPIFLGYLPIGMAFGVLARTLGFTVTQSVICSATALAGAGQFIALNIMKTGASVAAVLAATTVVNLRYVLFGATMSPHLRKTRLPLQAALAFTLTDETFAINIADRRRGTSTGASMFGVGAISWVGWVGGTLIGAALTGLIGDPTTWGLDFAMAAMFSALFIALSENRRQALIGMLAGAIALGVPLLARAGVEITTGWTIIIASMAAATIGAVVDR